MAPKTIRNVALAGHAGSGKTLLADALLTAMGVIPHPGDPLVGTTRSDFDPEEARRHMSVQTALLHGTWRETTINLLDTPGFPDFWPETQRTLLAADAVILVLDATKGVEVLSARVWAEAARLGLPVFLVLTRLDGDPDSFGAALAALSDSFGPGLTALTVPASGGIAHLLAGTQDDGRTHAPLHPVDESRLATARTAVIEAAADQDDALLERYVGGTDLAIDDVRRAWRHGVVGRRLFPVLAVMAKTGPGVAGLLDALVDFGPDPAEHPPVLCQDPTTSEQWPVPMGAEKALCGLIFKTFHDPYAGKISLFRVFSGTLHPDDSVWNANRQHNERFGRLFTLVGKEHLPLESVGPGDIAAVAKLKDAQTGDTILAQAMSAKPFVIVTPPAALPLYAVAITPKANGDDTKLSTVLHRLREGDPSLSVAVEPGTHRTVIGGTGQTQVDVALQRLQAAGIALDVSPPQIPYRETITVVAQAQGKHKKQTGGHGQYGDAWLRLEPLDEGKGYQFASEVVGGAVPKAFIPAVDKGVQESLLRGPLIGAPVVDLKAVITDGSAHAVDSSEMAFRMAAHLAFKKAFALAQPILLEPLLQLTVTVPEAMTGDVISDLTTRRAKVQGIDTVGHLQVIRAIAPMAEVVSYAPILTSITRGAGSYSAEFAHYEPVPPALQAKLIASLAEQPLAA
jgi:elongation factor G